MPRKSLFERLAERMKLYGIPAWKGSEEKKKEEGGRHETAID